VIKYEDILEYYRDILRHRRLKKVIGKLEDISVRKG
jgi:hypothetical protein